MATISSPGIGSGLDVQSIVSQLVALERAPLTRLETQASTIQSKLSLFGNIKSQMSALGDAASKLSSASSWAVTTAASSNAQAVSVTSSSSTPAGTYSVGVQQLARAQSASSGAVAQGTAMGTGSITIELGSWSGSSFTASGSTPSSITIDAGADSLTDIAASINAADAGVTAAVLRDASGERLLLQSKDTGTTNGFRITVADDDGNNTDAAGLSRLAFDPGTASGMTLAQSALDAQLTINGVSTTSASNRLTDTLPGMTLQLSEVTSQPVQLTVASDTAGIRKNIEDFVAAYNKINSTLSEALKYDEATKKAGLLQGDATAVGLQNALRSVMRSVTDSSPFTRLLDVGLEIKSGGSLEIDSSKLDNALQNLNDVKELFSVNTGVATTEGFGLKLKNFVNGLLDADGSLTYRSEALQSALDRNDKEQERITARLGTVEQRLLAQYSALDTKLAGLSSLNSFVTQQLALWNNS